MILGSLNGSVDQAFHTPTFAPHHCSRRRQLPRHCVHSRANVAPEWSVPPPGAYRRRSDNPDSPATDTRSTILLRHLNMPIVASSCPHATLLVAWQAGQFLRVRACNNTKECPPWAPSECIRQAARSVPLRTIQIDHGPWLSRGCRSPRSYRNRGGFLVIMCAGNLSSVLLMRLPQADSLSPPQVRAMPSRVSVC